MTVRACRGAGIADASPTGASSRLTCAGVSPVPVEHFRGPSRLTDLAARSHLAEIRGEIDDSGLSDEEIQTSMMRMISRTVIDPWRLRDDDDTHYKDQWNALVGTLLAGDMHWSSYRPRGGGLLVGDNSVCFSGVVGTPPAGTPAGFFDHGVATGFDNFRRLTVPLGSRLAVIISRDQRDASRLDVADLNRFTVFNSREFVAHAPEWPRTHPGLAGDLAQLLERQRFVAPAFLRDYAPGGRS